MLDSRISAAVLSRGSTWNPIPWQPPYLMADQASKWPAGATVQAIFYDTTGGVLAVVDGTVEPDQITFNAAPSVVDAIPAGAGFEIILTDSGGAPYQIRYGKVIRKEAEFLQAPPTTTVAQALLFTDSWPTLGLRSSWIPVAGTTIVYNNAAQSLPNGIGAKSGSSAIRWFEPLNGDTVKVNVSLINKGAGKTTIILCADQQFTSYLGVQFEETANLIHFCVGSAPTTLAYQGTAIPNTVANGDNYTITYNDPSKTLAVYKGANTSPLGTWIDTNAVVPHGPGYRYLGFGFTGGSGVQPTSWQAVDDA